MKLNFFFFCFVLVIIIIPHNVDAFPLSITQKGTEFYKSGFGICERNIKIVSTGFNKTRSFYNAGVVDEGNMELTGKLIKFLTVHQANREVITNPRTEKDTNKSETTANQCYFVGTKAQFYIASFTGGIIGLIIGVIIVSLFFYFTQRRHQREPGNPAIRWMDLLYDLYSFSFFDLRFFQPNAKVPVRSSVLHYSLLQRI